MHMFRCNEHILSGKGSPSNRCSSLHAMHTMSHGKPQSFIRQQAENASSYPPSDLSFLKAAQKIVHHTV